MSKRAEEILELHFGSEYWSIKESEYFDNVINAIDEALGLAHFVGQSEQLKCPSCGSDDVMIDLDYSTCGQCKNLW